MKKWAFTLSEVLLTIAIIGVVAAFTMPGVIAHYKAQYYVVQLQKSMSQFEQAMQSIIMRHECTELPCTGVFNATADDNDWNKNFEQEITKSIKVLKTAPNGTTINSSITSVLLKPKIVTTQNTDWKSQAGFKFMTVDGVFYLVEPKQCEDAPYAKLSTLKNICADVTIDVNSINLPNQYGRDIFKFIMGQNGHLYPYHGGDYARAMYGDANLTSNNYWRNNANLCASDSLLVFAPENVSGYGCAARIMETSWEMTY